MTHAEIADNLDAALKAWGKLPKKRQTRDSQAFIGINENVRRALQILKDENPTDVEALQESGLWTGHYDDPVPDTFVPAARELAEKLRGVD